MDTLSIFIIVFFVELILVILGVAYFIFWVFMLVDCINRSFGRKLAWLLIINLVPFGAVFYYFIVKRQKAQEKKLKPKELETLAIISFILALVSFKIFIYFGLVLGAIAIVLGIMAKQKLKKNPRLNGMELANAGIVLSIIGAALQALILLLYIVLISFALVADPFFEDQQIQTAEEFLENHPNSLQDNLFVQTTRTYVIDDVEYEVTVKNVTLLDAVFSVNGLETPKLRKDEHYNLPDGSIIRVNDLRVYSNTAAVDFYLASEDEIVD